MLSEMLKREGIPHNVLNARQHEQEAYIVADAGLPGAVTIATNMAGRGTDIVLGGNPDIIADIRLRKAGLDPVGTPEEYEAAWDEAIEVAREIGEIRYRQAEFAHRHHQLTGAAHALAHVVAAVHVGVEQLVRVHDEVAHVGVVDGRLGAGLPGLLGFFVVAEGADELDLRQVAEDGLGRVAHFAADDEVKQLGVVRVGHGEGVHCGRNVRWPAG